MDAFSLILQDENNYLKIPQIKAFEGFIKNLKIVIIWFPEDFMQPENR